LVNKDVRTVRRYLRVGCIEHEKIRKAVHEGKIDITIAENFVNKSLSEDEKGALYQYFSSAPKPSREFGMVTKNLIALKKFTDLSADKILELKYAHDYLGVDHKDIQERIELIRSETGKSYEEILQRNGSLIRLPFGEIQAKFGRKPFTRAFSKKARGIIKSVEDSFTSSKINSKLKLAPVIGSDANEIKITIIGPVEQIHQSIAVAGSEIGKNIDALKSLFAGPDDDSSSSQAGVSTPKTK
jgi:hypothetical protein